MDALVPLAIVAIIGLLIVAKRENMEPTRGPLPADNPKTCPHGYSRNYVSWLGPEQECDINRMGTGAACRQCHRTGAYPNGAEKAFGAGLTYASVPSTPNIPKFPYTEPRPLAPQHPVDGSDYAPWKRFHPPPRKVPPLSENAKFQPWDLYAPQVTLWGGGAGVPQYTQQSLPTGGRMKPPMGNGDVDDDLEPESAFDNVLDGVELNRDGEAKLLANSDLSVYKAFQDNSVFRNFQKPISAIAPKTKENFLNPGFTYRFPPQSDNLYRRRADNAVYKPFMDPRAAASDPQHDKQIGSWYEPVNSWQRESGAYPYPGTPNHYSFEQNINWQSPKTEFFAPMERGLREKPAWERGLETYSPAHQGLDEIPAWERSIDTDYFTSQQTPYRYIGHPPLIHDGEGSNVLFEKGLIAPE